MIHKIYVYIQIYINRCALNATSVDCVFSELDSWAYDGDMRGDDTHNDAQCVALENDKVSAAVMVLL